MTNTSYEATKKAIDASLAACDLGYIDLYLLHSAIGGSEKRRECWRAVCDAKKEGKVRSIGVSNFGVAHLKEMLEQGVELPVINQVGLRSRTSEIGPCIDMLLPGGPSSFHDKNRHRRYLSGT